MIRERLARVVFSFAYLVAIAAVVDCHPTRSPVTPTVNADAGAPSRARVGAASGFDFYLNQGDVGVAWSTPITDNDGNTLSLAGATVSFRYRAMNQSTVAITNAASVSGPPWVAMYRFTGADTTVAGDFNGAFVVSLPVPDAGVDGGVETFSWPQSRYLRFAINPAP